jgi:membrane protein
MRILKQPKAILGLLKGAVSGFLADNGMKMSAALAYYTIFSLAPLLVISIAIAGWVFGEKAASNSLTGQIQGFVGHDAAQTIQTMIQSAHRPNQGMIASVVSGVILLFGATGVFAEIRDSLNGIWHVERDHQSSVWTWIRSRSLSIGMVVAVGFLLMVSLVMSALLAGTFKFFGGIIPVPEFLLHSVEFIISLLVLTGLFALIFSILPAARLGWSDVSFGAFATAILFTAGKSAIGLYLGKTISASAYGAAGSLLVVVAWVYYSALIFYFGAELTRAYATRFGSLVETPAPHIDAKPKTRAAGA